MLDAENSSVCDRAERNRAVALDWAAQGVPVHPCKDGSTIGANGKPDRAPLTPHGFKDATTDRDQILSWWTKFPNAVPGIPTGKASGLIVLDVDRKDAKDGAAGLREIGFDPEAAIAPIVDTPTGGLHLVYAFADGIGCQHKHLPEGVEMKGEGGFVFAPGAVNAIGAYKPRSDVILDRFLGLPDFPARLMPTRCGETEGAEPGQYPLEMIRDALFSIPPDSDYPVWFECIAAVHHETGGSKAGRAICEAWSACGGKWKAGEVGAKWRSLGKNDGARLGAGTLFKIARENGWADITADSFDDLDDDDDNNEAPDLAGLTFDAPDAWAARPPRDYVVKGLVAPGQQGCIFGEPGAGKSVIAPRLAYAVAQGEPFFGMKTKAGPVFYVACEDEEGMGARMEALRQQHGEAPHLRLVRGCSDLFSPGAVEGRGSPQFEALRRQAKRDRPSLIIIDTLAMSAPGLEENAADGMGRINAISSALAKFGAAVIWIHHGTKAEGNTPRGHSSFNGRLDFSLHVRKADQTGIVRASFPKNRLGSSDRQLAYRIRSSVVGTDVDGDEVTAPICFECEGTDAEPIRRYSASQKAALAILHELAGEDGEAVDESSYRKALREDRRICGSDKPESRKKAVTRTIQFIASEPGIAFEGGVISLSGDGPKADDFEDCHDDE